MTDKQLQGASKSEKSDDQGKLARNLETIKELAESVDGAMSTAEAVTKVAKVLKEPQKVIGVSSNGQKIETNKGSGLTAIAKEKITSKILSYLEDFTTAEIKKLTSEQIQKTRERVRRIASCYDEIGRKGVTKPILHGFVSYDYLSAIYHVRIADAIEKAISSNIERIEEERILIVAIANLARNNVRQAKLLQPHLMMTSKVFASAGIDLSPLTGLRGFGSNVIELFAECAINMMALSSELQLIEFHGPTAIKVLDFQAATFRFAIDATRAGHESKLAEMAKHVRDRPDDVPPTVGREELPALLYWLFKKGGSKRGNIVYRKSDDS